MELFCTKKYRNDVLLKKIYKLLSLILLKLKYQILQIWLKLFVI